jgi:hypothetical protein
MQCSGTAINIYINLKKYKARAYAVKRIRSSYLLGFVTNTLTVRNLEVSM